MIKLEKVSQHYPRNIEKKGNPTEGNPSLELVKYLHQYGLEIYPSNKKFKNSTDKYKSLLKENEVVLPKRLLFKEKEDKYRILTMFNEEDFIPYATLSYSA